MGRVTCETLRIWRDSVMVFFFPLFPFSLAFEDRQQNLVEFLKHLTWNWQGFA